MAWKTVENDEYESSAPAVQAHFHAVRAEEAFKHNDYVQAEKEGHLASERFLQAAQRVADKRTVDALVLLAENYEYRAKVARARNPSPAETNDASATTPTAKTAAAKENSTKTTASDGIEKEGEQSIGGSAAADPQASVAAETQLNLAAAEMEELWRRLHEIGLSSAGSSDTNVLMSSRHLSSSLGDSFCLLPAKARTSVGVVATAVDGGSTLRAAVASRMRNQRQRLMEQQYGGRAPVDPRRSGNTPRNSNSPPSNANSGAMTNGGYYGSQEKRVSRARGKESPNAQEDAEGLQETITHQKYEIVRLLNAVKTLSSENTKLVKKCDALTSVQTENREIRESMEHFKKNYNQKLVMIKRALEVWRRQRGVQAAASSPSGTEGENSELESKLKMQEEQIAKLTEAAKIKDDRLAKYDKWYKTLKAGAKAKQLSQSRDSNGSNSFSSTSGYARGDGVNTGGSNSLSGATSSFTSSTFHGFGAEEAAGSSTSSVGRQSSRPPAHPNRRAL